MKRTRSRDATWKDPNEKEGNREDQFSEDVSMNHRYTWIDSITAN